MRSVLITVTFIAAAFSAAPALHAQDMGIGIGKTPGRVTVETLDGKALDLSKYIGKGPVLIEFWATWCPNCRELMPTLLAAEKKFGSRVKFLAVAVNVNQSADRVRKFLAAHPLPHETVWDADGNAASEFDAPATSYVVVLNKAGVVVYTGLGGRQNLEAAIAKALK
jgi:thiol-disulfide isomerase/thioredoxin